MASTSVDAAEVALSKPPAEAPHRLGNYRWLICALLFFASTINYVDRQVIGILEKDLRSIIGWSQVDYGNIVAAFNAAYALGLLVSGRLIDRFGTKTGYSLAIIVWSLAGIAASLAASSSVACRTGIDSLGFHLAETSWRGLYSQRTTGGTLEGDDP